MTIKQDLKVERYKLVAECVPDPVLYFNYDSRWMRWLPEDLFRKMSKT
jgi:dihydrodipicolinate synthase/N-acetylneuraminate lyase